MGNNLDGQAIVPARSQALQSNIGADEKLLANLLEARLVSIRYEIQDNPYIAEAFRVLPVHGYRSAIGCIWNAVVDDLRNKIIARSLELFNKSVKLRQEVKTYEDFQNHVNDDELIEGAYKTGVIDWEASKVLRHAKETRHIFDGHPRSGEPTPLKVAAMIEDCFRYVLSVPFPPALINISDYLEVLKTSSFDRNQVAVENAVADLPEIYKNELANRLFTAYVHPDSPSTLRSNIEFMVPLLWHVLPKAVKFQIIRRVDQEIQKGNAASVQQAFSFVRVVGGNPYLSAVARRYTIQPIVERLAASLDNWVAEDAAVSELEPYADVVPEELVDQYVSSLVHTYVGTTGHSAYYSRTDFYANGAAVRIPGMLQKLDDRGVEAFIKCLKTSSILHRRIAAAVKLRRVRSLANVVLERASDSVQDRKVLEALVDEARESEFKRLIGFRTEDDD